MVVSVDYAKKITFTRVFLEKLIFKVFRGFLDDFDQNRTFCHMTKNDI